MHRALWALLALCAAGTAAAGEIRSIEACEAAVAADPAAAREEASMWSRLGGGPPATLCEALALEAMGADGSAALLLTKLAENRNKALAPEQRAAVLEDAARLWLAAGRADLALASLGNLDRIAPPATRSRIVLRAKALAATEDWPAVLAELDAAVSAMPDDAELKALQAAAFRKSGDVAAARNAAAAALALSPDLPAALFEAGAAAAEAGDRPAAEAAWRRLIEAHPDDPLATLARRNLAEPG